MKANITSPVIRGLLPDARPVTMPQRVRRFFDTYNFIMQIALRETFQVTPSVFNHRSLERLNENLSTLLRLQNLSPSQISFLNLGNLDSPNIEPSDMGRATELYLCQYRVRYFANLLDIRFAYNRDENLVMGTSNEIQRAVDLKTLNLQKQMVQEYQPTKPLNLLLDIQEGVTGLPTIMPPPPRTISLVLHRELPQEFLSPKVRVERVKTLVAQGDMASASLLLFGSGTSPQFADAIINNEHLQPVVAKLCEAGDPSAVSDYLYWTARKKGAKEVLDIIRGQVFVGTTHAGHVGGFQDQRKAAIILFKLSLREKGSNLLNALFRVAKDDVENKKMIGILGELHSARPDIFENPNEFQKNKKSVFKPKANAEIQTLRMARPRIEIIAETTAPDIISQREGSKETAIVLYNGGSQREWDFEFGVMNPAETLIASAQNLSARGDYESACDLIFGVSRTMTEVAAVLRLSHLTSFQIARILEQLGTQNLRRFLAEAVRYGRKDDLFFDLFFDGILFGLSRIETEDLADLLEQMIHHQLEDQSSVYPQREAAYCLLHEGIDPCKERLYAKYVGVLEAVCARRPEEYAKPVDFMLNRKLLASDASPTATRAQVRFYQQIMLDESRPPALRLEAMIRLSQIGRRDLVNKFLVRKGQMEIFLGMIDTLADVEHPFLRSRYNAEALMEFGELRKIIETEKSSSGRQYFSHELGKIYRIFVGICVMVDPEYYEGELIAVAQKSSKQRYETWLPISTYIIKAINNNKISAQGLKQIILIEPPRDPISNNHSFSWQRERTKSLDIIELAACQLVEHYSHPINVEELEHIATDRHKVNFLDRYVYPQESRKRAFMILVNFYSTTSLEISKLKSIAECDLEEVRKAAIFGLVEVCSKGSNTPDKLKTLEDIATRSHSYGRDEEREINSRQEWGHHRKRPTPGDIATIRLVEIYARTPVNEKGLQSIAGELPDSRDYRTPRFCYYEEAALAATNRLIDFYVGNNPINVSALECLVEKSRKTEGSWSSTGKWKYKGLIDGLYPYQGRLRAGMELLSFYSQDPIDITGLTHIIETQYPLSYNDRESYNTQFAYPSEVRKTAQMTLIEAYSTNPAKIDDLKKIVERSSSAYSYDDRQKLYSFYYSKEIREAAGMKLVEFYSRKPIRIEQLKEIAAKQTLSTLDIYDPYKSENIYLYPEKVREAAQKKLDEIKGKQS